MVRSIPSSPCDTHHAVGVGVCVLNVDPRGFLTQFRPRSMIHRSRTSSRLHDFIGERVTRFVGQLARSAYRTPVTYSLQYRQGSWKAGVECYNSRLEHFVDHEELPVVQSLTCSNVFELPEVSIIPRWKNVDCDWKMFS